MKKKEIIQVIITGILIIVLLILLFGGKKEKKADQTRQPVKQGDQVISLDAISIGQILGGENEAGMPKGLYARLEWETRNVKMRRSPFSQQYLASVSGPYLSGIFTDPGKPPRAIINGRIVKNGDRVKDHYMVVDILSDKVILMDMKENKEVQLELFE